MGNKKARYFQDPLFEEFQSDTCYVCCGKIPENKGVCVGHKLWRHVNCKPGSKRWSESNLEDRHAKTNGPC
jgi:hypothetical protein